MSGLSAVEIDRMRHALGLNRSAKSYRNYYDAGVCDVPIWLGLVERELAVERPCAFVTGRLFYVTDAGKQALAAARAAGEERAP